MTERLTDEQLREWRDGRFDLYAAQCSVTAMELLALRSRVTKLEGDLERAQAWITKALDEPTTEERDALRDRVATFEAEKERVLATLEEVAKQREEARAEVQGLLVEHERLTHELVAFRGRVAELEAELAAAQQLLLAASE